MAALSYYIVCGFNEAPAFLRGKPRRLTICANACAGFNEAPAFLRGKRTART